MKKIILLLFFVSSIRSSNGQQADSAQALPRPFTISYTLDIQSSKKEGVAESYNGALKTIFIGNKMVRSRMVSLLRVQNVFYNEATQNPVITVVKESGQKYKRVLNSKEWSKMNRQYDEVSYEFLQDSINVLDYPCKKVILHLQNNKTITAYYTTQINHPLFGKIEPAFAGVPGIVLQYEYINEDAKLIYIATDVAFNPIAANTFKIP
ncbi:MAG TPA: hypothetical protein PK504_10565 [Ferruginibacter sp.]|nr:hypothetical protein [Ferruginibacter sp.]HRE62715.1 hypothetical protein [Ferruginibacter sp.]